MKPWMVALGLIALVALVAFGTSYAKKQTPAAPVTITLGVRTDTSSRAPLIILQTKKYWEQYGLNVKVIEFANDDDIRAALAANKITIGSQSITSALPLISQGVPVRVLAQTALGETDLFVRNDGSIKKISDLKGKKLGGSIGGSSALFTRVVLADNGIDPDKDVQFVSVKKQLQPLALSVNKDVDAVFGGPHNAPTVTKDGAIVLQDWLDRGYGSEQVSQAAIVAQADFVAKHPREVEQFLKAYKQAFTFIAQQPDVAAQIVADYITTHSQGAIVSTKADVLKDFKQYTFLPWTNPADLQKVADQAYRAKVIDHPIAADQLVFSDYQSLLKQ